MKKKTDISNSQEHKSTAKILKVEEAPVVYFSPKKNNLNIKSTESQKLKTKEFTYKEFKKIADLAPFTISEWAMFLHISERTLQRYAADNSSFNGLQIERILHLEKFIEKGNTLFGKGFKQWLNSKPFSINFQSPKDLLMTYDGIQDLIDLLGRIEHGISA